MASTTSANVIIPEVWGDLAQAQFEGAVKVLTSGAVVYRNDLEGNPGDTVDFGAWDALTDLVDLTETDVLVPEAMGTSSHNVTIKEAGKAVAVKDRARLVGLGDPVAEGTRQFGVLAARKLDADLIAAAVADYGTNGGAPLSATVSGGLTYRTLVPAFEQFADEFEPEDFAGLFVRPEQRTQLMLDDDFIKATDLGRDLLSRGQVGSLAGIPVFTTSRLASGTGVLVKRNALGALYKRRPIVETDRDILARETVVTTNVHYAVKRMSNKGVLAITFGV